MPTPLAFGICGLGFMGRTYFAHLRHHARARVAAVFDRDERRRRGEWGGPVGNLDPAQGGWAEMDGVRPCADIDALLDDPSVDVVAVTLPTPLHADVSIRALAAGKHVICEKPMALSLRDCDRMLAAADAAGRTLMIAQCIRFWPQYETIARLVADGAVGRVRYLGLRRVGCPPTYSSGNWMLDHRQSGGGIFDLHIHDVDFAQVLLGTPRSVVAVGGTGPSGGVDHVAALWRYADGRYACIEGGWVLTPPAAFEMSVIVRGESATLEWSLARGPDVLLHAGGDAAQVIHGGAETGWTRELDYFIDRVSAGLPVERCTPRSSRLSVGLTLLERRCVETGRPVDVPPCITDADACAPGRS